MSEAPTYQNLSKVFSSKEPAPPLPSEAPEEKATDTAWQERDERQVHLKEALAHDLTALATQLQAARKRRGWSLNKLGAKIDLTGPRVSQILSGKGAGCAFDVWFALGEALDLPFKAEFGRDRIAPLDL